jgi:hypothetical protein
VDRSVDKEVVLEHVTDLVMHDSSDWKGKYARVITMEEKLNLRGRECLD